MCISAVRQRSTGTATPFATADRSTEPARILPHPAYLWRPFQKGRTVAPPIHANDGVYSLILLASMCPAAALGQVRAGSNAKPRANTPQSALRLGLLSAHHFEPDNLSDSVDTCANRFQRIPRPVYRTAVIDREGLYAPVFPCRRVYIGCPSTQVRRSVLLHSLHCSVTIRHQFRALPPRPRQSLPSAFSDFQQASCGKTRSSASPTCRLPCRRHRCACQPNLGPILLGAHFRRDCKPYDCGRRLEEGAATLGTIYWNGARKPSAAMVGMLPV
ncbi:hypothetical protein QO004_006168 [Rhizobium mesoamericanum]|nr:hypothetical protein [Rhizobium mesoamericanum]